MMVKSSEFLKIMKLPIRPTNDHKTWNLAENNKKLHEKCCNEKAFSSEWSDEILICKWFFLNYGFLMNAFANELLVKLK